MSNLSEQDRKAYEAYILASTDAEKQEAIKKLIPGSHLYYHLYFLDRFKKVGANLTEEDKSLLAQFRERYASHIPERQMIDTRLMFLEYDAATSDEERGRILQKIGQSTLLNLRFDHQRPEDFQKQDDSQSSQSEDESGTGGVSSFQSQPNVFGQLSDIQHKKTSKLDYDKLFSKDKIMAKFTGKQDFHQDSQILREELQPAFDHKIDFKSFDSEAVYNWACENTEKISDLQNETFYEALASFFPQKYKSDKHFALDQSFCDALTIAQLDKISTIDPKIKEDKNFIGSYFQKQFNEELSQENQEIWSNDEKRANLLNLYKYAKAQKHIPSSLPSSLLIEILNLGIKLNIYDEELFREFLEKPLQVQQNIFKASKKVNHGDIHWNRYINTVQSQQNKEGRWFESQNELINKYLEHFCQEKGSLESFKDDFESQFLKNIEEKIAIYKSDDMTNLKVDLKKYQTISQEVIVRFLESNQEVFRVDEEVKLSLELKNIQTLYVKIFEFNTETYYKKTLQPFNTGINLDGLVASTEKTHEFKNPPNKKFIESFTFPELTGKIGLFIVEFIGNGMSSRAVIKKGSLSLIHKPTIAGHLAYVLEENKNICSGPKTGVYFDGQYFASNQEKGGKIFIPYGKSTKSGKAILMNNGFAQLCDFERLTENYKFSAWIYVNRESILVGNNSTIIIKPSLLINKRQASVEILKNTKITLTTTNYIDNIPVSKTFENVKFKNDKEYLIDFQVPPYLSNIEVKVETEVFNITLQNNQKLFASNIFKIDTHQNSLDMNDLYLRKEQDNYCLYLLGKNGEPKKNVNIQLQFAHYFGVLDDFNAITLTTDKEGRVQLGSLKKVLGLGVQVPLFEMRKMFQLNHDCQNLTYPTNVDVVENETLEFPVTFKNKKRKNISLIKKNGEVVLEDLFDKIEFIQQDDKLYNKVVIKGLTDGSYVLNVKNVRKQIAITIHKGQYWEGDTFILKRNCLFENKAPLKMVKIANVQVEENKQGMNDFTIKLDDFTKDTRVHVFANQFESYQPHQIFVNVAKHQTSSFSKTVFPFAMWKNIFMSNRELSDEFRYVFDRKYAERFQGNTLERP